MVASLDGWSLEHNETSWSVERVVVAPEGDGAERAVSVELAQGGRMVESTVVRCCCDAGEIRAPIWPYRGDYDVPGASVRRVGDCWTAQLQAPGRPSQVEEDPDHVLLDARSDNNRWKPEVGWPVTPLMTPLDE